MHKFNKWSTVLSCVGAVGTVATAVLAVKATPKALKIIEREEQTIDESLTTTDKVKLTWKCYIPAIMAGTTTIACIFGANKLNKRALTALMSSYIMLDNSYKEYKNKVTELYGEESVARIKEEIAKDHYDVEDDDISDDDKVLFFDYNSLQYFNAKMSDVIQKTELGDGMECYIITSPFDWKMDYL